MRNYYHTSTFNPHRRFNVVFSFYPFDYLLGLRWNNTTYSFQMHFHFICFVIFTEWRKYNPDYKVSEPMIGMTEAEMDKELMDAVEEAQKDNSLRYPG